MRSHISTASSMLWVTIRIDLIGMRPSHPEIEKIGAQRLGGQHVEGGERLVHQEKLGIDDERARKADALAHAARQLLRVGGFEAVEADQIDRRKRAAVRLALGHGHGAQAKLDVFEHRQPREQREALEHHGDALGQGR